MFRTKFKTSIMLSKVIAVLAVIASAGGLLGDFYRDNALIKAAWHGNDLVTLFVAVPMMLLALRYALGGTGRAQLIWMGTLWYMIYNYIFYLYGAVFNVFFLVYAALFTLSIATLILILINIEVQSIVQQFQARTPVKWISGFMLFFSVLLGGIWVALSLSFIFTGQVPQAIIQTGHPTGVVFATDLSLLIPAMVLSAILLWKRQPWGYILSSIVLIKAVTYGLALIVMSAFAYIETGAGDPMIPLWAFLSLGCLISCVFLLGNMKSAVKEIGGFPNEDSGHNGQSSRWSN